mmetsp:Transcript_61371/g.96845  ORF Transcript_61371/g.96845 Transcript_61371/m.96845 type:complete len:586 (+) Transcript_61371:110-1867(+)
MVIRVHAGAHATHKDLVIYAAVLCFEFVRADVFNSHDWARTPFSEKSAESLAQGLMSKIRNAIDGKDAHLASTRLESIEKELTSMFQVMPKNRYGKLGQASVRYMMHRYFVEQRGWVIEELLHGSSSPNMSSPAHRLSNWLPVLVDDLFEKRIGDGGFDSHRMAIVLTTVEDAFHDEAQTRLMKIYEVLRVQPKQVFNSKEADIFLDAYMVSLLVKTDLSAATAPEIQDIREHIGFYYSPWPATQRWLRELRQRLTQNRTQIQFEHMSQMVQEITNEFGHFHGRQCRRLKSILTGLEEKASTGCVRLPDFYAKGVDGGDHWHFVESPDFLRHMGVLDESSIRNPRVLVANYIHSPTNCVQTSSYFLVCCQNECDSRLAHLERQLGAPSATPEQILSALGWDLHSVGKFPATLRRRLYDVSHQHRGHVPIHGRLFAQWLHHAYPHECQYPHLSSQHPMWVEIGKSLVISEVERKAIVHNASAPSNAPSRQTTESAGIGLSAVGSCVPWTEQEEALHVALPPSLQLAASTLREDDPHVWGVASVVAMLGALVSTSILVARTCKPMVVFKAFAPKEEEEACPQLVECL